jgi:ArsR family transcriptional regulator, virulence genes transcriptional regulator
MKKSGIEKAVLTCDGTLKQPIIVDYGTLRKAVLTIRALEHELRIEILKMLIKKDMLNVSEIYNNLNIEQSVASQHLAILRRAGILKTKRNGKFINYFINHERIDEVNKLINELN